MAKREGLMQQPVSKWFGQRAKGLGAPVPGLGNELVFRESRLGGNGNGHRFKESPDTCQRFKVKSRLKRVKEMTAPRRNTCVRRNVRTTRALRAERGLWPRLADQPQQCAAVAPRSKGPRPFEQEQEHMRVRRNNRMRRTLRAIPSHSLPKSTLSRSR